MSRGWLLVLVGCGAGTTVVADVPAVPEPALAASETALGPLDAKTPGTLVALRAAFAGYDVFPAHVAGSAPEPTYDEDEPEHFPTLEYQVFERGEKLLRVVPSQQGGILNVHITSRKIGVAKRPWRVGAPLIGATHFDQCECWDARAVCFKRGEHVAVAFEKKCVASRGARRARILEGATIAFLVWSPRAFGATEQYGGDAYGDGDEDPDDP
jgi:hypothetical protein